MKVIVSGGGTGGHIYPALAIAEKIKEMEPDSEILYIGGKDGIEKDLVPEAGYRFETVPVRRTAAKGSNLQKLKNNVKTGLVTLAGTAKAMRIISREKPDVVIGTGGFVCVPAVKAASMKGVKSYIHEQNAYPGIANRLLQYSVSKIFLGIKDGGSRFKCKNKMVYTGNPVRKVFYNIDQNSMREELGIPKDDFVVFAFGGSQGAGKINEISEEYLRRINEKKGVTFIFGTGNFYYDSVIKRLEDDGITLGENIRIMDYIKDMEKYIGASDLVIARAGALSLAEITLCGKPSILIPSPIAKDNHQYFNAKSVADHGGAFAIEEKDVSTKEIIELIEGLEKNPKKLLKMGQAARECSAFDAADIIYREIRKDLEGR